METKNLKQNNFVLSAAVSAAESYRTSYRTFVLKFVSYFYRTSIVLIFHHPKSWSNSN